MGYYNLGIDIGSTTVKTVLLDDRRNILYKSYERHFSQPKELLSERLRELQSVVGGRALRVAVTGSAGMGLAEQYGLDFVQEVFATTALVQSIYPQVKTVIELGGEDAKLIFLDGTIEERMNSTCAGGTGAFIDQMASLLDVTTQQLDELSLQADSVYPIASRCGVFAKTDIQPLINQGAKKENIAASIYRAVVDQTITGLAQGRRIVGSVLFLGGPLTFLKGLQAAFCNTLKDITPVFPQYGEYFVASAAAYYAGRGSDRGYRLGELLDMLQQKNSAQGYIALPPLFTGEEQYEEFVRRHGRAFVERVDDPGYSGRAYLGIDAGSTTTKTVLIDDAGRLLYSSYRSNKGNPLEIVTAQLAELYERCPLVKIDASAVTGYGEELVKHALNLDIGMVETLAHYTAARYFCPDVDFIIDIGGQDMKCFGIADGMVDRVTINEACSSGCGSFIETFASSLGYTPVEFAQLAIKSEQPVDLGSRCTVFMNSSVKEAQKNGAKVEDIAAGLAISVVTNAICKVLRVSDASGLGKSIVVQGGTFLNDAVLRAFELQVGAQVTRPEIAGIMGAFGAALTARANSLSVGGATVGGTVSREELAAFTHKSTLTRCGLCQNRCSLTINEFRGGRRFISGNRCERPTGKSGTVGLPNLYEFKQGYFERFAEHNGTGPTIGLPLVLNFYDTLPFWFTLLAALGFSVKTSLPSTRDTYRKGQHTIPSDTVCYGAKLVHGHVLELAKQGADAIFYPRMSYNYDEGNTDNNYHCPVVAYYPEVIANSVGDMGGCKLINPYIALNDSRLMQKQLMDALRDIAPQIKPAALREAHKKAEQAQRDYREAVLGEGARALDYAREHGLKTIVLAGRPYHVDPEINHGIDRLIAQLGFVVISEDALPQHNVVHDMAVLNQWSYHARMYNAAGTVCGMVSTELVQLVSFGCGLDAVTTDEIKDILQEGGKLYTAIKIDEINNLGAVRIRLRSLLGAMEERGVKSYAKQ